MQHNSLPLGHEAINVDGEMTRSGFTHMSSVYNADF